MGEVVSEPLAWPIHDSEARLNKLWSLKFFIGSLSLKQGLALLSDRIGSGGLSTRLHTVDSRNLEHPFTLTASRADFGIFSQTIAAELFCLPKKVDPEEINGENVVIIGA